MRILGIDYGAKRVGLAISDPLGIAAHGLRTLERSGDESVLKEIAALVAEHGVEEFVIGLPKNMDDTLGGEARRAMAFAEAVRRRFSLPVHMVDERLTSARAERSLKEANVSRRDMKGKKDRIAAQLILQIHLDRKGRSRVKEKIELREGDITKMDVDAVVNAANNDLLLGAGVAGAIRKAGGPTIQEECNRIGRITLGEAAITGAGQMKAKYVIHAASMALGGTTTEETLRASTKNSLLRAEENGVKTLAFPAIGTGVAGFPLDECARIMLDVVIEHLKGKTGIVMVYFCLFGKPAFEAFRAAHDALTE